MATYKSNPVKVDVGNEKLFSNFNDLTQLQRMMEQLPPEAKAQIGDVKFEKDTISINTPQMGEVKFFVKERTEPEKVVFGTESSPVPLTLTAFFKPLGDNTTEIVAQTDVDVPPMLKMMIGGTMQRATDQFAMLLGKLSNIG